MYGRAEFRDEKCQIILERLPGKCKPGTVTLKLRKQPCSGLSRQFLLGAPRISLPATDVIWSKTGKFICLLWSEILAAFAA